MGKTGKAEHWTKFCHLCCLCLCFALLVENKTESIHLGIEDLGQSGIFWIRVCENGRQFCTQLPFLWDYNYLRGKNRLKDSKHTALYSLTFSFTIISLVSWHQISENDVLEQTTTKASKYKFHVFVAEKLFKNNHSSTSVLLHSH